MLNETTDRRRLAIIMFTDLVGYSALSQGNEAVPQGHQRIAQRFIAGLDGRTGKVPQGRKNLGCVERLVGANLSPLRGFPSLRHFPSVETLGYCLSPSGLGP